MITEHAIDRYIQRVMGNPVDIGELERLIIFKEISFLISNSTLLYKGDFYTKGVKKTTYYKFENIIFVFEKDKLVTLWKLKNDDKTLLKKVNIMKTELLKLTKSSKEMDVKFKEVRAVTNYALENKSDIDIESLISTEMAIRNLNNSIKAKMKALDLVIATELHNYIYSNLLSNKVKPLEFFITQQKCYNENRINALCEGLKLLKEEGIIDVTL